MVSKRSNRANKDRSFVASLERGLRVIKAFGETRPFLSVSEMAGCVGISRAAARRFLKTFEQLGYVGCDADQRYYLKPAALSLGYSYLSSLKLDQVVVPALTAVMERAGDACSMAVLDGPEIVYLARVAKHQPLNVTIRIGDRLPAYSTALGRILLAGKSEQDVRAMLSKSQIRRFTDATITNPSQLIAIVEQARQQGWTSVISEQLPGLASVAVPVRNIRHQTVAALNASAQHVSSATNLVDSALPLLRIAAAQIEFAISRVHSLAAHLDALADVNHDEPVRLSDSP